MRKRCTTSSTLPTCFEKDPVVSIATGQKVVTVVELLERAVAVDFDPQEAIRMLKKQG